MTPNFNGFLESWSQELAGRANRVRNLIGDAHWLSDGHHKEGILVDFLRRYLPSRFHISRGFIKSFGLTEGCSPEIDILISDYEVHPTYFNECGLQIVAPVCALALLEVKTRFAKEALRDAVLNQVTSRHLMSQEERRASWAGICFYDVDSTRDIPSVLETIGTTIGEIRGQLDDCIDPKTFAECCPLSIAVSNKYLVFLRPTDGDLDVRAFETGDSSLACFLIDMMGLMHASSSARLVSNQFANVVEQMDVPAPTCRKITFP